MRDGLAQDFAAALEVGRRYAEPESDVDSGELYWALHKAFEMAERRRSLLAIYIHAHRHGNAVPPVIEAEAMEAARVLSERNAAAAYSCAIKREITRG